MCGNMNLLVGQSGGPTAVINSSLAGVIAGGTASDKIDKIYGAAGGIAGILEDDIVELTEFSSEKLSLLKQTPSSYLGSCRKKLGEDAETYEKIFQIFKKYNIGYFLYIGGNDSMDTVDKLSGYAERIGSEVRICGVPKTIDNDLVITDHTPGYGSAAKFVANTVRQLALDTQVYKMKSVIVLEIMGRNAGWLTAAAALGNDEAVFAADTICLPERVFDPDKFLDKVAENAERGIAPIIAVSEGIKSADGKYIGESLSLKEARDGFAHAALGGVGRIVENLISEKLKIKTRTIELSTLQRCFAQGASERDIEEAFAAGYEAVKLAERGETGFMPCFKRLSDEPYEIEIVPMPVCDIANYEKTVPDNMIGTDGMSVTADFIKYGRPLISGEPERIYENGILKFIRR